MAVKTATWFKPVLKDGPYTVPIMKDGAAIAIERLGASAYKDTAPDSSITDHSYIDYATEESQYVRDRIDKTLMYFNALVPKNLMVTVDTASFVDAVKAVSEGFGSGNQAHLHFYTSERTGYISYAPYNATWDRYDPNETMQTFAVTPHLDISFGCFLHMNVLTMVKGLGKHFALYRGHVLEHGSTLLNISNLERTRIVAFVSSEVWE